MSLPHTPFVLGSDGQLRKEEADMASNIEQEEEEEINMEEREVSTMAESNETGAFRSSSDHISNIDGIEEEKIMEKAVVEV